MAEFSFLVNYHFNLMTTALPPLITESCVMIRWDLEICCCINFILPGRPAVIYHIVLVLPLMCPLNQAAMLRRGKHSSTRCTVLKGSPNS